MAKKFSKLRAKISPQAQVRAEARAKVMLEQMPLVEFMERCDCKTNGPCLLSRRELPDDQHCVECYCAGYFCANDECECICHPGGVDNKISARS